jgi:hypothetical protein
VWHVPQLSVVGTWVALFAEALWETKLPLWQVEHVPVGDFPDVVVWKVTPKNVVKAWVLVEVWHVPQSSVVGI